MTFKLGILGAGLQGTEAACLALWAGWQTVLADARPSPPASGLSGTFIHSTITNFADLDRCFKGCDLLLPACEDLATLELVSRWAEVNSFPLAFDLQSYRISCDKAASKELFLKAGIPTPLPYPAASFPVIAKPVSSSGSRGVRLLNNQTELDKYFLDKGHEAWIVEEYCPGPSYSLEVTGTDGNYRSWLVTDLAMDEIYDCRQVSAPTVLDAAKVESFHSISVAIAKALKLKGLMDVEIIDAPQGLRVLEIDARFPSQTPTVVYWQSGENLLARLAEIYTGFRAEPASKRYGGVIYEHIHYQNGIFKLCGEHIMATARPLSLCQSFYGADWAITDYSPNAGSWSATIIITADSMDDASIRREEILNSCLKVFPA